LSNIGCGDFSPDNPVQRSLSAIREAHFQLRNFTDASVTSDALASQIALYELILCEVADIRAGLAKRFCNNQSDGPTFQMPLRRLN
jgi:hypothetical protein